MGWLWLRVGIVNPMTPPPLPRGKRVKVVFDAARRLYCIVTTRLGDPVGPRLDRMKGVYPLHSAYQTTLKDAVEAMQEWDKFLELQEEKKKR